MNYNRNIIGFIICVVLMLAGFAYHGNIGLYFNLSGLLIVVGGSLGATLLAYRLDRLQIVYNVLLSSYQSRPKQPEDIVEILVDLSVKSKYQGLLSLQEDEQEASLLFMRRALGLLVDGYNGEQMRDILNTEMYFFKMRREDSERVLRTIAEFLPAFGLVGSVVGLISMLAGVGDKATILQTVPIALTSTLYGVVFAHFFFIPFAGNLRERTDHELLLQKIVLEGVVAIESEMDPRKLEKKLKSFLTPSSRKTKLVSIERIQKRFHIMSNQEYEQVLASNVQNGKPLRVIAE